MELPVYAATTYSLFILGSSCCWMKKLEEMASFTKSEWLVLQLLAQTLGSSELSTDTACFWIQTRDGIENKASLSLF